MPAALSIQAEMDWRTSWPIDAPALRKSRRIAARETNDDTMSQTRVLKVSRHVICLASCRGCRLNENKPALLATRRKKPSSRDSVPSQIEGQPGESPLKSTRRSASSAGILMYRRVGAKLEVLLVHPA